MAFNLIADLKRQMKETTEQVIEQIEEASVNTVHVGDKITLSEDSVYSRMNIQPEAIVNYVQAEVARLAPPLAIIATKPFQVTKQNITVTSNGVDIFIGKRFFTEPIDVLILETLKICVKFILGFYIVHKTNVDTTRYKIYLQYVLKECYDQIVNTILYNRPTAIGLLTHDLGVNKSAVETCLSNRTQKESELWVGQTSKFIQKRIEVFVEAYTIQRAEEEVTMTITFPTINDICYVHIPSNLAERYRQIKSDKDKASQLRAQKNSLYLEKVQSQQRKWAANKAKAGQESTEITKQEKIVKNSREETKASTSKTKKQSNKTNSKADMKSSSLKQPLNQDAFNLQGAEALSDYFKETGHVNRLAINVLPGTKIMNDSGKWAEMSSGTYVSILNEQEDQVETFE